MKRTLLYFAAGVIFVYFLVYFLSNSLPQGLKPIQTRPTFLFSICEDDDTALLITTDGNTVCKDENSLYIREQGKKKTLKKIDPHDNYVTSSLDYLVFFKANELVIEQLTSELTLKETFRYTFPKNLTPVSLFFYQTKEKVLLYISTQKEATSAIDVKTSIFQLELSTTKPVTLGTLFSSKEMLIAVDVFDDGNTFILKEMYPFLISKRRILRFDGTKSNVEILWCSESPISYASSSDSLANFCSRNDNSLILTSTGQLLSNPRTQELLWQASSDNSPTTILNNVNPTEWQLVAKYSTRIGKRVYNCFDFSESLQITLRTCISEL